MSTSQRVFTPLKNHLVRVRTTVSPVPVAGHTAHFQRLHETYLHEVDGEDCFEHPMDVLMKHLNKHKDNFGPMTVLLDLAIANNGMHHNVRAIHAGEMDHQKVFTIAWVQDHKDPKDLGREAEGHVLTAEGKTILPVDLHDAAMLYGLHHGESARGGVHPKIPSRGGQVSLDAIAALDDYLKEIGVEPNHPVIRREFCHNCRKKSGEA